MEQSNNDFGTLAQIDQLFHETLACEPAERVAFLASACDGDEELRLEVESLITSHEEGQSFIEKPAGDVAAELLAFTPGRCVSQNTQL